MKFITNKNLIFSIKLLCILCAISNIFSAKNNLKTTSTAATEFLSKIQTEEVKDPKSLFKPEAETCKPVADYDFDDAFPKRKKNFFDILGFNEGPITYLVDYIEEALEKYSNHSFLYHSPNSKPIMS